MTDSYTPGTPELLPCPFCGDAMRTNNSGTFGHTGSAADCIIGQLAWEYSPRFIASWNTRSCNLHGELVAALEPFAEACRNCVDEDERDSASTWEHAVGLSLSVADFRRALAAIAKAKGGAS